MIISTVLKTCESNDMEKSKLPAKANNITIEWHKNGGFSPFYEKFIISKDSCIYDIQDKYGVYRQIKFQLSEKQIDSLYSVFVLNKFDKIETEEYHVTDRGGTNIRLNVDSLSFYVSDSGISIVKKLYIKQYIAIEKAIISIVFDELELHKIDKIIDVNQLFEDATLDVSIVINDEIEYYFEKDDNSFEPLVVKLFEKNNVFLVIYSFYDEQNDKYIEKNRYKYVLQELPTNKNLVMSIKFDNLIVE